MTEDAYESVRRSINDALRGQENSLDLSGNQLTALPPEVGRLTALQRLDLGKNQLTALPPEIGQLTALQRLELGGNRLTALPPEIGQLTALQRLDLGGNQLTALPPEIGQLTALQRLELSGNQLTALPPEIGQLTALQRLDLGENQLTALPPEIGQLTALQRLGFSGNQLPDPYPGFIALAQPETTRKVLAYLRGELDPEDVVRLQAVPAAIAGVISPVDFTASRGRPIRAKPSVEAQPVFKTPVDKRDHKPRLDLCRKTAVGLLNLIENRLFNIRDGYRRVLSDYIRYLPLSIRNRTAMSSSATATSDIRTNRRSGVAQCRRRIRVVTNFNSQLFHTGRFSLQFLDAPRHGDIKIYFQGRAGSGKSLIQRIVVEALAARGLQVHEVDDHVARHLQIVDLTSQNLDDTLLISNPVDTLIHRRTSLQSDFQHDHVLAIDNREWCDS
jgi:Leucine rich repeat